MDRLYRSTKDSRHVSAPSTSGSQNVAGALGMNSSTDNVSSSSAALPNPNQELVEDALASELIGHIGIRGSEQDAQPLDFAGGKVRRDCIWSIRRSIVCFLEILRREIAVHKRPRQTEIFRVASEFLLRLRSSFGRVHFATTQGHQQTVEEEAVDEEHGLQVPVHLLGDQSGIIQPSSLPNGQHEIPARGEQRFPR